MAIGRSAWRPRTTTPRLRFVHPSPTAFRAGIEEHVIEGESGRVDRAANTAADCFKFKSKVGLDVAIEASRDDRKRFRSGLPALWRYAKLARVDRVLRPYLEALG